MKSILLSVLGLVLGAITNLLFISVGHLFLGDNHFLIAFLAHALGAFVASFFVCKMKVDRPFFFSMCIGGSYLGMAVLDLSVLKDVPIWFILSDLLIAHLPMAYLGYKLGQR
jgi:hypothetical protein